MFWKRKKEKTESTPRYTCKYCGKCSTEVYYNKPVFYCKCCDNCSKLKNRLDSGYTVVENDGNDLLIARTYGVISKKDFIKLRDDFLRIREKKEEEKEKKEKEKQKKIVNQYKKKVKALKKKYKL